MPQRQPDEAPTFGRVWHRFVARFFGGFLVVLGICLAAIILIDPYDTGYFPSLIGPGVVDPSDVTSILGRGRDSRFNAALFGNSHGLLLDPARLSPATGLSFVQLIAAGSGPREQMTVMRYFLRRHADARAFVLVADDNWCTHDPDLVSKWEPPGYRFPYWLFADDRLRYLAHMLNTRSFGQMRRRIRFAMGLMAPDDPAGVAAYPASWDIAHAVIPPRYPGVPLNGSATQISTEFPAIDRFEVLLSAMRADIAVVVTMPPIYYRQLPDPHTVQSVELASCKERIVRAVARRPHGVFIDFLVDSPLSRQESSFFDQHHMNANVARVIEARIVEALNERH